MARPSRRALPLQSRRVTTTSPSPPLPFGAPELIDAVRGAERVLDMGCGSGRLTVALAQRGAEVTGFDTSAQRLDDARRRAVAADADVPVRLLEADADAPLPFADASFDAVTSRLVLMVVRDPVATLTELQRVLVPEGRIATAVWAALPQNPWFDGPREAVRAVLGEEAASFARAFGRLGTSEELAATHRAAGFADVDGRLLQEHVHRADADEHWRLLAAENGHYRRIDAALAEAERSAVARELSARLEPCRSCAGLAIPRTMVLVTGRRP